MREIDSLISEYQHESHRPRESEALLMLRKVASLVKPIMRQRAWRVGTLCEFYPHQRSLLGLNVNAGQKICLRLRYPSDQCQFLPLEHVVDTMLHELCHIVHGPHNRNFHALWHQLRDEHEELVIKGYTGEGFLSQGRRLGGRKIPMEEARRQARAAAEQRRKLAAGSGQRLGGAPALRGTDMRRVIADAAQRRTDVTNGCASGRDNTNDLAEEASRNGFRTKAEEDDANEQAIMQAYIELIQQEERERYGPSYIPPSHGNPAGPRSIASPTVPESSSHPTSSLAPPPSDPADLISDSRAYDQPWTCPICTLENPPNFLCCDACAVERPRPSNPRSVPGPATATSEATAPRGRNKRTLSETGSKPNLKNRTKAAKSLADIERNAQKRPLGWLCHSCGSFMETEYWTCSNCGLMKQSS